MIKTIEDFYTASRPYVVEFDSFARRHGLEGIARADHICYKCGSGKSFESMRSIFEENSRYIHQSLISKRRIAYIKLKREIQTALDDIAFLELSDQKPDLSQTDGFDHIEVYGVTISYDELVRKLSESETVIKVERPHHTTHDIEIRDGFLFRCTPGPLIEKIKREEM